MHLPYIPKRFYKAAGAKLAYKWNWTRWLAGRGDTISSVEIIAPGLTVSDISHSGGVVTASLAGGVTKSKYIATCKITTTGSTPAGVLTDERSLIIIIKAM